MPPISRSLAGLALLGLTACTTMGPMPGTPEFAAAQVSRAYDCGLRVDRARVIAGLDRQERQRFMAASAGFAVKSYKAPRFCDVHEQVGMRTVISNLLAQRPHGGPLLRTPSR